MKVRILQVRGAPDQIFQLGSPFAETRVFQTGAQSPKVVRWELCVSVLGQLHRPQRLFSSLEKLINSANRNQYCNVCVSLFSILCQK